MTALDELSLICTKIRVAPIAMIVFQKSCQSRHVRPFSKRHSSSRMITATSVGSSFVQAVARPTN